MKYQSRLIKSMGYKLVYSISHYNNIGGRSVKSICFTGHRKIGNKYYTKGDSDWENVIDKLHDLVKYCIVKKGYRKFYTGGALGVDTIAFNVVATFHSDRVKLNLCIPTQDHGSNWFNNSDKMELKRHKSMADTIYKVWEIDGYIGYNIGHQLQKRNEFMVDNSDLVIAVWDGVKSGGTWNCVKYAIGCGKQIIRLDPNTLQVSRLGVA